MPAGTTLAEQVILKGMTHWSVLRASFVIPTVVSDTAVSPVGSTVGHAALEKCRKDGQSHV